MPRRWQTASLEPSAVTSHGLCSAVTVAACSWAEVPKGTDRNAELKLRLREAGQVSELISKILEQQHSGPLRRRQRVMQPQTDEQRGKRARALTAWGSIRKAVNGLVGGPAQGSADCRKTWTIARIPRSSGSGTHPTTVCRSGAN